MIWPPKSVPPALEQLSDGLRKGWKELPQEHRTAPLGICLSAGADSCALALAAALAARSATPGTFFPEIRLLHVRHELRGSESRGDWQSCSELAAALGLCLDTAAAPLVDGPGLEARARVLRYQALRSLHPRGLLATAHHRDDQAETVLLRLLRGAGPLGLCGIAPLREDAIWRPFLRHPRSLLRATVTTCGWDSREDSSNRDTRFARNALRHGFLPAWEAREPGIGIALCSLAESAWALRPHLLARLRAIELLTDCVTSQAGWSMDLSRWDAPADDPELDMVLERLWTRTGRRPWSRPHRIRLVEDVVAGKTGTRTGGQGEIARFGKGLLSIESLRPLPDGRSLEKDGSSRP